MLGSGPESLSQLLLYKDTCCHGSRASPPPLWSQSEAERLHSSAALPRLEDLQCFSFSIHFLNLFFFQDFELELQ